jgi:hypothetical protein
MIFPELPRRRFLAPVTPSVMITSQPEPAQDLVKLHADQWFERHFPETKLPQNKQPAVSPQQLMREKIEFAVICIGMVIWAWFWHQFQ